MTSWEPDEIDFEDQYDKADPIDDDSLDESINELNRSIREQEELQEKLSRAEWSPINKDEIAKLCISQFQAPTSPPGRPLGNFLKWSKTLPQGKIFLQKHGPWDKKISTPGEYCERSSQLILLVGIEIF